MLERNWAAKKTLTLADDKVQSHEDEIVRHHQPLQEKIGQPAIPGSE